MGNIQAATKPPTVSSVPSPPIPGSTPPPPIQSLAPILSPVVIANPGTYEDLHKNFKGDRFVCFFAYIICDNFLLCLVTRL